MEEKSMLGKLAYSSDHCCYFSSCVFPNSLSRFILFRSLLGFCWLVFKINYVKKDQMVIESVLVAETDQIIL